MRRYVYHPTVHDVVKQRRQNVVSRPTPKQIKPKLQSPKKSQIKQSARAVLDAQRRRFTPDQLDAALAEFPPRLIATDYGKWLALSAEGFFLRIGVIEQTEDAAREGYGVTLSNWLALLNPAHRTHETLTDTEPQ